mmetsp:Transcript_18374/g.25550  ORF Transcript_18374/g.25550 Transcript_18374/m.25550 type:complete len:101 (+) Transcript_18374:248-550(+)
MKYTSFGKPNAPTYMFAQEAIETQAGGSVDVVYGIGDNPASDIAGANDKDGWESILLKTGVWDGVSRPAHIPNYVVNDVLEGVERAVQGTLEPFHAGSNY